MELLVFDWPISKTNRQLHLNSNLAVKAVLWQRHANLVGCASLLEHSIIVDHKASGKYISWSNLLMAQFSRANAPLSWSLHANEQRGHRLFICLHPSTRCHWSMQSFHLKRGMWCFIRNFDHLEQRLGWNDTRLLVWSKHSFKYSLGWYQMQNETVHESFSVTNVGWSSFHNHTYCFLITLTKAHACLWRKNEKFFWRCSVICNYYSWIIMLVLLIKSLMERQKEIQLGVNWQPKNF